jgi:hypothetical protein
VTVVLTPCSSFYSNFTFSVRSSLTITVVNQQNRQKSLVSWNFQSRVKGGRKQIHITVENHCTCHGGNEEDAEGAIGRGGEGLVWASLY